MVNHTPVKSPPPPPPPTRKKVLADTRWYKSLRFFGSNWFVSCSQLCLKLVFCYFLAKVGPVTTYMGIDLHLIGAGNMFCVVFFPSRCLGCKVGIELYQFQSISCLHVLFIYLLIKNCRYFIHRFQTQITQTIQFSFMYLQKGGAR